MKSELQSTNKLRKLIPLTESKNGSYSLPPFIAISHSKGHHIIKLEDIVFLKSESNYTNIYLKNGKKILCSKTLKSLEFKLPSSKFYRVHRSYLVPLDKVSTVNTSPFSLIIGDFEIPVSKDSKTFIKELFLL